MLARTVTPTADFRELASYFLHGKTRPTSPDRVAWTQAHNLPTDDPVLAADLMAATARQNRRTSKPVYHLMVAWGLDEHPTPESMQDIARRTLELAGLAEHQALVMGHGDTPHRHLHMMINRVHPLTGKAWKPSHDWRLFDRIMKQLADEHGFAHTPAHVFNPETTRHLPKKPTSKATYAAKRGANTRRTQWSRDDAEALGARLSETLDAAGTFEDVADALTAEGLTLEAKGRGYVAGTATSYVKLSALRLTTSAKGFAKRHQPAPPPTPKAEHRSVLSVDAVDIARALEVWGLADKDQVRAAIEQAATDREQRLATAPAGVRLMREIRMAFAATTSLTPARSKATPSPRRVPARRSKAGRGR